MPPNPGIKKSKTSWPLLLKDVKVVIPCSVTASPKSLLYDSEPGIQADYVDVYDSNGTIISEGVPRRSNTASLGYGGKVYYELIFDRHLICDMEYGTDGSRFMPREYYHPVGYDPAVRIVYWYQDRSFEQIAKIPVTPFLISNGKIQNTVNNMFKTERVTIEIDKSIVKEIGKVKKFL